MRFTATWTIPPIDVTPDFSQETGHTAKASEICEISKTIHALVEERAECGAGCADGAADEVDPDETAVVANLARGDEL